MKETWENEGKCGKMKEGVEKFKKKQEKIGTIRKKRQEMWENDEKHCRNAEKLKKS